MYLAALSQPDDSCHLTTGISAKADPLASIDQFKSRWNAMVRANQIAVGRLQRDRDHDADGPDQQRVSARSAITAPPPRPRSRTRTPASAWCWSSVSSASESSLQTNFPCIAQADIDQTVDLLNDPQVYAASVNQPAQIDSELAGAQTMYDVGIVNESFGAASRETLEMLQQHELHDPRRPVGLLRADRQDDQRSQRHHQGPGGPHRAGGGQRRRGDRQRQRLALLRPRRSQVAAGRRLQPHLPWPGTDSRTSAPA